jgi:hypothetical protein
MTPAKPKLRKREILAALAAGGLAAGAAAIILEESNVAQVESSESALVASPEEQDYQVQPFTRVETFGPQDLIITRGEEFSVRSDGAGQPGAWFEVVNDGDKLVIRPRSGREGEWHAMEGVTFYVTLPVLEAVTVAGIGDVEIDRIEGDSFSGSIAGLGELTIASLKVENADFSIAGAGSLSVAGTATHAKMAIRGAGNIEAEALISDDAEIDIAGAGNVELTALQQARISIAGGGDVDISGTANCTVSKSGFGSVSCNGREI